jgi:hypothetical protein
MAGHIFIAETLKKLPSVVSLVPLRERPQYDSRTGTPLPP